MKNDISHVYIASDHRGVGLKLYLYEMLMADGYNVVNLGTDDLNTPVDFPDIANKVAEAMLDDSQSRGILICGTGAGMEIAANRHRHIRASRVDRPEFWKVRLIILKKESDEFKKYLNKKNRRFGGFFISLLRN